MPSPFPGMDPFLEEPSFWPDFHHDLISEIKAAINQSARPNYFARVEQRVYISDDNDPGRRVIVPDVRIIENTEPWRYGSSVSVAMQTVADVSEPIVVPTILDEQIEEFFLEIIDRQYRQVVTVIEVVSPTNKVTGARGSDSYRKKRAEVLSSPSHFVEIDLLREGQPVVTGDLIPPADYYVHVSRVEMRPSGQVWPIKLPQRLPSIKIPLRAPDPDLNLDLQSLFTNVYDRSGYDLDTNYEVEPTPPLPIAYREWADRLLREKGMRSQSLTSMSETEGI